MRKILLIGAGRSSVSLIKYLAESSAKENWQLSVADFSLQLAQEKTKNLSNCSPVELDINNEAQRQSEIKNADLVISLLPANMHTQVAQDCITYKKHLVTASYISAEMKSLSTEAKSNGLTFMNECGLDPGIDHMSAMKIINDAKRDGYDITLFKSYCGGLVAPESNDNPWGYKFSWNPRNVVLAGQSTAQYVENGLLKYIPYNRLFLQTDTVEIDGFGKFDAYANRDSLSYREPYGIENVKTMLRGTLRNQSFCKAWNAFVKLGLTDDSYKIYDSHKMTYAQLLNSFLPDGKGDIKSRLTAFMGNDIDEKIMEMLSWLGIFDDKKIEITDGTPAQILQALLEEKWKLKSTDKDMIVMQHIFEVVNSRKEIRKIKSSLVVKGDDSTYTAMAKTVGLPAAIAAKLILNNRVKHTGVIMPIYEDIYLPILSELETFGIVFSEEVKS